MSHSAPTSPPCIAIVDRCVPHYRKALYEDLMHREECEFWLVAPAQAIEQLETIPYPNGWRWIDAPQRKLLGNISWQWGAIKAGFSRQFDTIIIMAIPHNLGNWGCALAARLTGKRLLLWTHGYSSKKHGLKRLLHKSLYRLAHGFLLYGHTGKCRCINAGFSPDRCHVIYNSLDLEQQKYERNRLRESDIVRTREEFFGDARIPMMTCITRMRPMRRLHILLEAHKLLLDRGLDVGMLLIGDGPIQSTLEAQADRLGIRNRIIFYGACYEEETLARLLSACDVCVSPGNIGLTAMHSLVYGVPVITHDDLQQQAPESEAIIPGKTGDFFRIDDPIDLADVLQRWLTKHSAKRKIQENCKTILDRFYTPQLQAELITRAALGRKPDDLYAAYRTPLSPCSSPT
jgi:glycosyltransferase involved in cell wall biosynthesis